MKLITVAGLKGGVGKSSVSRVLAEKLKGSVLNFDPKRDGAFYNAVPTINIPENIEIKREKEFIVVDDKKISSKNGYLIADFGGQYDKRLSSLKSDFYILPTADDFESISETIRTAKMILNNENKAKIVFILNKYLIRSKKDEETALNDFKTMLKENDLNKFKVLEMPYSKIFKNIVNEGAKAESFMQNAFSLFAYKNINEFIKKLTKEVK